MATDSILGLFTTPEQYALNQRAQVQQQLAREAEMDPYQRANYLAGMSGYSLGTTLGNILGVQDPTLQRISQRQQLLKNIDFNDPTSLANASRTALEAGDVQASRELAMAAQKARDAQLEAAVKTSQITRNTREPRMAALPNIAKLQEYRQQRIDAGAPAAEIAEINKVIAAEGQGKGTNINLGLSTVDKEANLRQNFTAETKPITTALSAADKIEKLLTTQTSLGDIIAKKQFAKVAGDTNISNKDVAELANYGDLGQRLAGTLSQFFEGRYTQGQREEALALVKQLKGDAASQYSTIQSQYRNRAVAEKLPEKTAEFIAPDLAIKAKTALPPEGTRLRNKKTGKIEVVQGGKLVPVSE